MSEHFGGDKKQQDLKEIIRDLHAGTEVGKVQKRFAALIKNVSPEEIARMEQALITEGVPVEKVQSMCDLHVAVFEESLKKNKKVKTLPGHPVKTFTDENAEVKRILRKMRSAVKGAARGDDGADIPRQLSELKKIDIHYLRKENLLFPLLEAAGFTGPTKVMWGKHDEIRDHFKELQSAFDGKEKRKILSAWSTLSRSIRMMTFMEERILYPTSLRLLSDPQWAGIRKGESELGYAWIQPGNLWDANIIIARNKADDLRKPAVEPVTPKDGGQDEAGEIPLDVGAVTPVMVNLLLKNLPLDITYVDEHDKVRYYSQGKERLFPRTPAIIGRDVENCHPPKSVHVVKKIVDDFRSGEQETAEFWLTLGGKFIHIRYFALYADDGTYKGVLEVSQDITGIRALEGEKRLLD